MSHRERILGWLGSSTLAVTHSSPLAAGGVVAWGYVPPGEGIIDITKGPRTNAVPIAGSAVNNPIAITVGSYNILILTRSGSVFGWGANGDQSVLGYETPSPDNTNGWVKVGGKALEDVTAIAAGSSFSIALRKNGTLATWGRQAVAANASNIVAISAGGPHALAVCRDGAVLDLSIGGTPIAGLTNVVAISAAKSWFGHFVFLTRDGQLIEKKSIGQFQVPVGTTNISAISAGWAHNLALLGDGTVFGWGYNEHGEATGVPTPGAALSTNISFGVVKLDGNVLSNVCAISAGQGYSLALKKDGTVVAWGLHSPVPVGLKNVVAIEAAEEFCLAITTNSDFTVKAK